MSREGLLRAGQIEVAPGDGLLARRPEALLFVARPRGAASWSTTFLRFLDAADADGALAAVLDHAVDQHLEVGPFAAVSWGAAAHLVVFGDLTLVSDLPSVPRLSGTGMPTWVEHRATRVGDRAEVRLGEPSVAGTDLVAGIVPAGGFRITLLSPSIQPARHPATTDLIRPVPGPPPAPDRPVLSEPDAPGRPAADEVQLPSPGPVAEAVPSAPRPMPAPPVAGGAVPPVAGGSVRPVAGGSVPPVAGGSAWDVLRDAGGAWMDDSLQLSEPRLPRPTPPEQTGHTEADAPDRAGGDARRPGPHAPAAAGEFDPEITLDAGVLGGSAAASDAPPEPGPLTRYVQARRCADGHLNPPLRTHCRVCAHYLPPATRVETVPQPALATLVLGDGRAVEVVGPVVLGRTPDAGAARLDEPGTLVAVGDATVSRTHAVVSADGWTLLAVDCGTTGGTAIAPPGGEPALLEPWVPHELTVGDTLFLGGPTKVQVVARHE